MSRIHTNTGQFEIYVAHLEQHELLRTPGAGEPRTYAELWENLTTELNACDVGPTRTTMEWQAVMKQWKHKIQSEARHSSQLTELKKRALKMLERSVCAPAVTIEVAELQYERFVEYIEKYSLFVEYLRSGEGDPIALGRLWLNLCDELNTMGFQAKRTVPEWKEILLSWKDKVILQNAHLMRLQRVSSSVDSALLKKNTPLEERMMSAIGQKHSSTNWNIDQQSQKNHNVLVSIDNNSQWLHPCQYAVFVRYLSLHEEMRCGSGKSVVESSIWQSISNELNAMAIDVGGDQHSPIKWRNEFKCWIRRLMWSTKQDGVRLDELEEQAVSLMHRKDTNANDELFFEYILPTYAGVLKRKVESDAMEKDCAVDVDCVDDDDWGLDDDFADENDHEDYENDVIEMQSNSTPHQNAENGDCVEVDNLVLKDDSIEDIYGDDKNDVSELQSISTLLQQIGPTPVRNMSETLEIKTSKNEEHFNGVTGSTSLESSSVQTINRINDLAHDVSDIKSMFREILNNQERIISLMENNM